MIAQADKPTVIKRLLRSTLDLRTWALGIDCLAGIYMRLRNIHVVLVAQYLKSHVDDDRSHR
jgi:hypothetical protein